MIGRFTIRRTVVAAVLPAAAVLYADWRPYGDAGIQQDFTYDTPSADPIYFGGRSRSENAMANDYCVYLDVYYADGSTTWGVKASFSPGTHDWEDSRKLFVPDRPVKKIFCGAFLLKGTGKAEFDGVFVERRNPGFFVEHVRRMTERPYRTIDVLEVSLSQEVSWSSKDDRKLAGSGSGRTFCVPISRTAKSVTLTLNGDGLKKNTKLTLDVPASNLPPCPVSGDRRTVWTADSMTCVTPLTYPDSSSATSLSLLVARRGSSSAQINITSGEACGEATAVLEPGALVDADGRPFPGTVKWERVGYIRRRSDDSLHPNSPNPEGCWLPDPLLTAGEMRLRAGGTQGAWLTVSANADARAGIYSGAVAVKVGGRTIASVPVSVRVCPFSQPATFGLQASFSVMDGFTRRRFPENPRKAILRCQELMLDHRLAPDDISRTEPPSVDDVARWRERGMNRFCVLNLVPKPDDPDVDWVCYAGKDEVLSEDFFTSVTNTLTPYLAELGRRGLDRFAYIYGFDERGQDYYDGMETLWRRLKALYPNLPLMTTARMFEDIAAARAKGEEPPPHTLITDWHCPVTDKWDDGTAKFLAARGMDSWWYVACDPRYPYANFSNVEYPPIEGRLLAWMTYLYGSKGLLFWHVNFWPRTSRIAEDDTFSPDWSMNSSSGMYGDGILLYPGTNEIHPSIRLAQIRDGVQDYEWLSLVEQAYGAEKAKRVCSVLVKSLTDFERDPALLNRVREAIVRALERKPLICFVR